MAFTAKDTAWTKVAALAKKCLTDAATANGRTLHVFTAADRGDLDALSASEIPGVIIGVTKVDFEFSEMQAEMRHTGLLLFSVNSGIDSLHIDPGNQDIIAFIVATLAASDCLGGAVEFLDPVSMDASEQAAPDIGEALLTYSCTLYTPTDNFRTIIGRGGIPY